MNCRVLNLFLIGLFTALIVHAQPSAPLPPATNSQPSVSDIAEHFTTYQKMTKNVVMVNMSLAMYCITVNQKLVDSLSEKFGPHALAGVIIYMNESAAKTFGTNGTIYPVGSVIVKQKMITDPDASHFKVAAEAKKNGVGGMMKRPLGFDPKHGDWEYFYFEKPEKIESGRISSCIKCHDAAKTDHVFGNWNKG